MGYGEGVSPSPLRLERSEEDEEVPLPENFFLIFRSNCTFWCILGAIVSAIGLRCLIQQGKGRLLASWEAWSLVSPPPNPPMSTIAIISL